MPEKLTDTKPYSAATVKDMIKKAKKAAEKHKDASMQGKRAPRNFSMIKAIQKDKLYKQRSGRDAAARAIIESSHTTLSSKTKILPGQLVLFKYLNPKTADELEYYDASPCTIFFNVVQTSEGKRVLGFNLHYFPPQIRYRIIDKIFNLFKPVYRKYFETGVSSDLDAFDYQFLIDELGKAKLGFAVRMYIPALIGDTRVIPPEEWPVAMFTEGWFKKETRARIMDMFRENAGLKKPEHKKAKNASK